MTDEKKKRRRKFKPVRLDRMASLWMASPLWEELAFEAREAGVPVSDQMRRILIAHAAAEFASRSQAGGSSHGAA